MNAGFFRATSRPAPPGDRAALPAKGTRARQIHRWVATVFTLTVALNFAMMPWGQPPAWIVYAPLPPLLLLMATGLIMLCLSWLKDGKGTPR